MAQRRAPLGNGALLLLHALLRAEGPRTAQALTLSTRLMPSHVGRLLRALGDDGWLAISGSSSARAFCLRDRTTAARAREALAGCDPKDLFKPGRVPADIRVARTCYGHFAGRLGVRLTEALLAEGTLCEEAGVLGLACRTSPALSAMGIDARSMPPGTRGLVRSCLDWSERRPHMAGRLATEIARAGFALGWVVRPAKGRGVRLTADGVQGFHKVFGIETDDLPRR